MKLVWEAHLLFQNRMNHEVGTKVEPASPGYVGDCRVTEIHELNRDIRQGDKVTEVAIFGRVPVEKLIGQVEDAQFEVQVPGQGAFETMTEKPPVEF